MQNNILKKVRNNKYFDFIGDEKLKESIELFFSYVLFLHNDLEEFEYDEFLTEFKTHTIIIYLGSVVEALVFYYANKKFWNNDKAKRKYLEIEELQIHQKIKESNFIIWKIVKKEISLNDSINFKWLIDWLKDKKLMSEDLIEKINEFRKARNSIHINVYNSWEEIFEDLIRIFHNFKDIKMFIKNN